MNVCIDDASRMAFSHMMKDEKKDSPVTFLGLKHIGTRVHRPKPNCEAERFVRTNLREWAYGA